MTNEEAIKILGTKQYAIDYKENKDKFQEALTFVISKLKDNHCKDCCCAKSWEALGIKEYTGKSIPEEIKKLILELETRPQGDTFPEPKKTKRIKISCPPPEFKSGVIKI